MSTPADNPMILVCKKCGEKNRLPCVHCRKCGAKLDFDAAEATLQEAARGRGSAGRTVRSLVLLALVAVLALALWPSGLPRRTTGTPVDAKRAEMKRDLMADALERGFPSAQTFTEAELNAWLAKLPAAQSASPCSKTPATPLRAKSRTFGASDRMFGCGSIYDQKSTT